MSGPQTRSVPLRRPVPRRGLRRDIQGLRALAVLLVMTQHLFGTPSGGYVGVDVFFVVSGYVITGVLLDAGDRGRPSLRAFYVRRVRRIVPAALLVLLATTVAARYVLSPLRARQTAVDSLWAMLFGANIHFARLGTDYFAQGRPASAVQHYWSLSVEEQFYIVWPLLLILVLLAAGGRRAAGRGLLFATALAASAVSLVWAVHLMASAPTSAYFSTAARAWELGTGAALAAAAPVLRRMSRASAALLAWCGLFMIIAAALTYGPATPFPGLAALLPVGGAALLVAADDPTSGPGQFGLLNNPVAVYLGTISYSLYLWHYPCIVLIGAYFAGSASGAGPLVLAGTAPFVLAVLSFHLLEDPVRRGRWPGMARPRHSRQQPGSLGRGVAARVRAATAVALLLWTAAPFPLPGGPAPRPRPGPGAATVVANAAVSPIVTALAASTWPVLHPSPDRLDTAGSPEWLHDNCLNVVTDSDISRCTYGDRRGSRLLVVMGDSMAASYMPGLRAALPPRGWRIVMLTFQECPNVMVPSFSHLSGPNRPYQACLDHRQFAIDEVRRLRPDVVVTSSLSTLFLNRIFGVPAQQRLAVWGKGTEQALAAVAGWTGRLVLLAGPPNGSNLQVCLTPGSVPADCVSDVPSDWYPLENAERAAAVEAGAVYVSPLDWLCAGNRCPSFIGATPVRWDEAHLTAAFSRSLAARLRTVVLGR